MVLVPLVTTTGTLFQSLEISAKIFHVVTELTILFVVV